MDPACDLSPNSICNQKATKQWRDTLTENKHNDKGKCTMSFSTVDLTPHLSFLVYHIWLPISFMISFMFSALKPLFLSLRILPSSSSRLLPPLSVSVSPSLSFCPFSFPLLCPPSLLLPAALPTRSHSPRSHTQAASSPLHFYLHTHLFTPPSQLLSPPSFFRHLLTHIIPRISPVCCLSRSPPSLPIPPSFSLTHSTLRSCQTHTYTHPCWLAPKDRAPSPQNRLPGGSISWPARFLTLSSAEEEDQEEAMEHSHFPVFPPNGSTWSTGQNPSEAAQGCPLGPLPVIYYSVLLCLGLPGKRRAHECILSPACLILC